MGALQALDIQASTAKWLIGPAWVGWKRGQVYINFVDLAYLNLCHPILVVQMPFFESNKSFLSSGLFVKIKINLWIHLQKSTKTFLKYCNHLLDGRFKMVFKTLRLAGSLILLHQSCWPYTHFRRLDFSTESFKRHENDG